MDRRLRIVLIVFLACVFGFSCYQIIPKQLEYKRGEDIYDEAIEMFIIVSDPAEEIPVDTQSPEPAAGPPSENDDLIEPEPAGEPGAEYETEAPAPRPSGTSGMPSSPPPPALKMDFTALAGINQDIIGWIVIPETKVNYPLLKGPDNDFYLNRTYNGVSNSSGSIYMDYRCYSNFSSRHTVIYGHNMKNGTMFGVLRNYASQSYYNAHRYFYIYTADGRLKYEIFSAHKSGVANPDAYLSLYWSAEAFGTYSGEQLAASAISNEVVLPDDGKVVTLITCTGNEKDARFFVHGILVEDARRYGEEKPSGETISDAEAE